MRLVALLIASAMLVTAAQAADPYLIKAPAYGTPAPVVAKSKKEISCSLSTEFHSRPLFTNVGLYGSKYSAQITELYCQHESGSYVDVWNLTPYGRFGDGGEVDIRAGWQKRFGQWSIDLSAAWYNFRLDTLGVFNTADFRGKFTYDFLDPKSDLVLRAQGGGDYQHSFNFKPATAFAVFGGVYGGIKLFDRRLEVGLGADVWKYFGHWADNPHATVYSFGPQINFRATEWIDLYAKAGWATGSVLHKFDAGWKPAVSIGARLKF